MSLHPATLFCACALVCTNALGLPSTGWNDAAGNRTNQSIKTTGTAGDHTTSYAWDSLNRLKQVTLPDGSTHQYGYDYRTRRISVQDGSVTQAIVFSGGLSLAEYGVAAAAQGISNPGTPSVQYQRGPDMGGGVGGLLYSVRGSVTKFNLSNGRGDIVAQSNSSGALTWTASYEAFGKRPKETGVNLDKQRGNSKDEDPTGLLNEGFRYRDLESGVWLSRDPAGFVDGPNLYAYVKQNPWTGFDPEGLFEWGKFGDHLYNNGSSMVSYANDGCGLVLNGLTLGQGGYQGHADSFVNKTGAALTGLGHDIGTLNDATHHALGGRLESAANTAGPLLGNSPEEVAANVVTMVATAGFGRLTKGLFRAAAIEESAAAKAANAEATADNSRFRGGAHTDIQSPGIESHHMPAKSVSGLGEANGPAIQMEPADHWKTMSNGKRPGSGEYREMIGDMISGGDMRGAMATEIRDVRRVARDTGNPQKYNGATREMMNYARDQNNIPKNPQTTVERTR